MTVSAFGIDHGLVSKTLVPSMKSVPVLWQGSMKTGLQGNKYGLKRGHIKEPHITSHQSKQRVGQIRLKDSRHDLKTKNYGYAPGPVGRVSGQRLQNTLVTPWMKELK